MRGGEKTPHATLWLVEAEHQAAQNNLPIHVHSMSKPNIFIGSSVEGLKLAYAIQENLEYDAHCIVWSQGVFKLSGNTLSDLEKKGGEVDFAVFVCSPDDELLKRDEKGLAVRDNVIFELGLFIGKLGRERVFFVLPRNVEEIHFPTDLLGITQGTFDSSNVNGQKAALGPFCNKVRERVEALGKMQPSPQSDTKSTKSKDTKIEIEEGVWKYPEGTYRISLAPTVFFSNRIVDTFPGVRNGRWFTDPQEIINRLIRLFKEPFIFQDGDAYGVDTEPIWWIRGTSSMYIDKFKILGNNRVQIGSKELKIKRMLAYYATHYYRHFVYLEVQPEEPITNIINLQSHKETMLNLRNYASEWIGIAGDRIITLEEYEDGAAEIDGEIVRLPNAERRERFLTPYNFIIASKYSPFHNLRDKRKIEDVLNNILKGIDEPEKLINLAEKLEKNEYDY